MSTIDGPSGSADEEESDAELFERVRDEAESETLTRVCDILLQSTEDSNSESKS